MLLSDAKERFQSRKANCEQHQRLIDDPQFQMSADAAMLQYAEELTHGSRKAKAAHHALTGAHRFLEILKNLGEIPAPRPKLPGVNLDHSK